MSTTERFFMNGEADRGSFDQAHVLAGLGNETPDQSMVEVSPPLSRESFVAQASDIFATVNRQVEEGHSRADGYRVAAEAYVAEAEDARMGLQAELILTAPQAHMSKMRVNELRAKIEGGDKSPQLDTEEREQTRFACEYNRKVRQLILENPDSFTRADLQSWLSRGSGGNEVWAHMVVAGAAAEAALIAAAREIPGISVDLGTVDDDLRGTDFTLASRDGRKAPVDVKFGLNQHNKRRLDDPRIVRVESSELDGFTLRENVAVSKRHQLLGLLR